MARQHVHDGGLAVSRHISLRAYVRQVQRTHADTRKGKFCHGRQDWELTYGRCDHTLESVNDALGAAADGCLVKQILNLRPPRRRHRIAQRGHCIALRQAGFVKESFIKEKIDDIPPVSAGLQRYIMGAAAHHPRLNRSRGR